MNSLFNYEESFIKNKKNIITQPPHHAGAVDLAEIGLSSTAHYPISAFFDELIEDLLLISIEADAIFIGILPPHECDDSLLTQVINLLERCHPFQQIFHMADIG